VIASGSSDCDLINKLRLLQRYEYGWDGRAAAGANTASFEDACSFAPLIGGAIAPPEESIHANGNAVLVFEGPGLFASLQFTGNGTIAAYVRRGIDEWDGEVPYDRESVPSVLGDMIGLSRSR